MVAPRHPDGRHARTIRRAPLELRAQPLPLGAQAAPKEGVIDAKTAQYLGELRDVAEAIRHVAELYHAAVVRTHAMTHHQVADQRLGADQKLVGQHVPGPHLDAPLAAVFLQLGRAAGRTSR